MLAATLAGADMGLAVAGIPHSPCGVILALAYLSKTAGRRKPVKDGHRLAKKPRPQAAKFSVLRPEVKIR